MILFDYLANIAMFLTILIIIYFYKNMFDEINSYMLVLLGFALFIFLDIFKYSILSSSQKILRNDTKINITLLSFLSLFIFIITYKIFKFKKTRSKTPPTILYKRFNKIIVPLTFIYTISYILYFQYLNNNYLILFSYISKSTLIISFYFYLNTKRKYYLYIFIFLISFSFFESSRRIYIAIFLIIIILFLINYKRSHKLTVTFKFLLICAIIIFYIFLNALRSEHDFGHGYIKDDKISNTIYYIKDIRVADTFYNTGFVYETFPQRFQFIYGRTYLGPIFGIIPRSIWPQKPMGFAADLGFMVRTNFELTNIDEWYDINMFSLSPGLLGESFANFGIFGVILIPMILGFSSKLFDQKVFNNPTFMDIRLLPLLTILPTFFLLLRGDFYSATLFSIYLYIYLKLSIIFIVKKN